MPTDTESRMVPDSCKPSNTSKRRLFFTSPMALPLATRDHPAQASQPTATTPWSTQQRSRWGRPPTTWRNYMACVRRSPTRGPGTTPTAAAHQDASTSSPTTCTPSTSVSASGRPKPTDRSSPPSKSSSPTCGDRLSSPLAGSRDTPMSKVMKRPISSPNLVPRPAHQTKSPPLCERPSPPGPDTTNEAFPQRGSPVPPPLTSTSSTQPPPPHTAASPRPGHRLLLLPCPQTTSSPYNRMPPRSPPPPRPTQYGPPVPSLYHTLAPGRLSIPHQAKDGRLWHRP